MESGFERDIHYRVRTVVRKSLNHAVFVFLRSIYVVTHQGVALMYCRFFIKIPSHGQVDGQSPA
jgi:hypothetical protein